MSRRLRLLLAVALCSAPAAVSAHALRMATVQLTQSAETSWRVRFTPAAGSALLLEAQAPCAWADAQMLHCPPATAPSLRLEGAGAATTHVLVKQTDRRAATSARVVRPDRRGVLRFNAAGEARGHTLTGYIWLGARHIAAGWDHLLFLLLLILVTRGRRQLVLAVSGFTLAHSVSLALVTFDVVQLRPAVVEALIALSLVFMAVAAVRQSEAHGGGRRPFLAALAFGLLHGLGFASALVELRLERAELPLALFGFNVGVELGQLLFVGLALALLAVARFASRPPQQRLARWATAYAVGALGVFWTLDRLLPPGS